MCEEALVIWPPRNPKIVIHIVALDEIRAATEDDADEWDYDARSHLLLRRGELDVVLYIADGPEAVESLVREAAPRLGGERKFDVVRVGEDPVKYDGTYVRIGEQVFRVDEVRDYAMIGANVPLPGGFLIQAASLLLVVEANGGRWGSEHNE